MRKCLKKFGAMTAGLIGMAYLSAPALAYDTSQLSSSQVLSEITALQTTTTTLTTLQKGYLSSLLATATSRKLNVVTTSGLSYEGGAKTSSLFRYGAEGMSAQGNEPRMAVWGQYGFTRFDEDQPTIDSDGVVHSVAVGGDYRFNNWLLAGLSFAFDRSDVTTTFNRGTSKSNGYTFAPYAVVSLIQDTLFWDASAGYSFGDNKSTRSSGLITGSNDNDRYFMSTNLSAVLNKGRWIARPATGVLWSRSESDAFRESNGTLVPRNVSHFGRMHVGSEFGYVFPKWEPFVGAKYLYDYKFDFPKSAAGIPIATAHRSAVEFALGTNLNFTQRLSGNLKGSTEAFREDNSTYTFSGSLRYAF
ncbi:MAG: autotransporter outer membrane beta-barrel domain-containing protein [Alphaproteobacteria bacterium]